MQAAREVERLDASIAALAARRAKLTTAFGHLEARRQAGQLSDAQYREYERSLLGGRSYEELLMTYGTLIRERQDALEALQASLSLDGRRERRRAVLAASGIAGLFLIALAFLVPAPYAVITGGVVASRVTGAGTLSSLSALLAALALAWRRS